jgi:predicted transcriptional regulator
LQKRRGRLEITREILTLCQTPKRKTYVMYHANLSHERIVVYLNVLTKGGFLEKREKSYFTTKYGLEVLEGLDTLLELLKFGDTSEILLPA